MRKLLKKKGFAPDVLVTDKFRSYCAARSQNEIVGLPRAGVAQAQSGREFASTDATARAEDRAFQIARISPTILVCLRRRSQHVERRGAPSGAWFGTAAHPAIGAEVILGLDEILDVSRLSRGQLRQAC
jgi:hypothetical protein